MALLDPAARLGRYLNVMSFRPALLAEDLGADAGVGDDRAADRGRLAVGDEQHALEGDRVAGLDVEQLDLELRCRPRRGTASRRSR